MPTTVSTHVKNQVWSDFTKRPSSKNELKKMFLGTNPTQAYKKISEKLKKNLDKASKDTTVKKTCKNTSKLSPKRSKTKSVGSPKRSKTKSSGSPKRSPVKHKRRSSINPFKSPFNPSFGISAPAAVPFSSFGSFNTSSKNKKNKPLLIKHT
jgi:hypothetical protein